MLLRETGRLPLYYFPKRDVRMDLLSASDHTTFSDHKGEGLFWHVKVGNRLAENAAFTFRNPPQGSTGPNLDTYITFAWNRMDHWFEEDEEVFVHARDPHKRIDSMHSSRRIQVVVDGVTVADTTRPTLLFETGLPTRFYVRKTDVRTELLEHSETTSACPYKGRAHYYSIKANGKLFRDTVWYYPYPLTECPKIEGLLAFYNEKVDIYEDGQLLPRPATPFT
jgi:uncharacterized protein (DUF427 family)